jgi:hypothetical protein
VNEEEIRKLKEQIQRKVEGKEKLRLLDKEEKDSNLNK